MQPDDVESAAQVESPAESLSAEAEPEPQAQTPPAEEVQATQPEAAPDYKALFEESERRRGGLDRKLSRLQRGTRTEGGEELFTGNEELDSQVVQHPLTRTALDRLATYQLKEGVEVVLKDYPHVPEAVVKAIKANPRGFVGPDATNVDEGLEDIETYIITTFGESAQVKERPKEFPVAQTNSSATEPTQKRVEDMNAEEIEEALASGEITDADLAKAVKEKSSGKEVKKAK